MKPSERKKLLRKANQQLKFALELIGVVCDDLRLGLYNIPENLKSGAHYEKCESNVDRLYIIMDQITYASDDLEELI